MAARAQAGSRQSVHVRGKCARSLARPLRTHVHLLARTHTRLLARTHGVRTQPLPKRCAATQAPPRPSSTASAKMRGAHAAVAVRHGTLPHSPAQSHATRRAPQRGPRAAQPRGWPPLASLGSRLMPRLEPLQLQLVVAVKPLYLEGADSRVTRNNTKKEQEAGLGPTRRWVWTRQFRARVVWRRARPGRRRRRRSVPSLAPSAVGMASAARAGRSSVRLEP